MKLKTYKHIWQELNTELFSGKLPSIPHRCTRMRNAHAFYEPNKVVYYWNLKNKYCKRSLVFHEMIHHWQDVNGLLDYNNPHDSIFFSWNDTAIKYNLKLEI